VIRSKAEARQLREELQSGQTPDLRWRRGVIALSLAGMASMTAVTLLQTGIVRHLPDPPSDYFDSDKVNLSETAYQLGVPDGTLSLASLAANIPLAALGGLDRAQTMPLVPLGAAVKAGLEALVSGWFFYQMPAKEKKWCGYCIVGALANFGIFALTIPEARRAWQSLRG
jgi:uncharacterized membrane protein